MISNSIATDDELKDIEKVIKKEVLEGKKAAWNAFVQPLKQEQQELLALLENVANSSANKVFITKLKNDLAEIKEPIRKDIISTARKALRYVVNESTTEKTQLVNWINAYFEKIQPKYSSHLYSESPKSALTIKEVKPTYDESSEEVDARLVLRDNFDADRKSVVEGKS